MGDKHLYAFPSEAHGVDISSEKPPPPHIPLSDDIEISVLRNEELSGATSEYYSKIHSTGGKYGWLMAAVGGWCGGYGVGSCF